MVWNYRIVTLYGCLALWCSYGCTRNQQKSKINNKSIVTNGVIKNMADTKDDRKLLLDKSGFKFPNAQDFQNKIKQIFGCDIKDSTDDIIELELKSLIDDEPDYLIIYRKDRFVDLNIRSEVYGDRLYLLAFNNYLFHGSKSGFRYMQKDLYHIYELVQDFGYWDNNLKDFIFKRMKVDEDNEAWFSIFFGRTGINGKWKLRKNIFRQCCEELENSQTMFIPFVEEILKDPYKTKYEGNLDEDVAYILELISKKALEKEQSSGVIGIISNTYSKFPELLDSFKKKDYYGYENLKFYSQYYEDEMRGDV
jgi:putative lipoprotein